MAELNFGLLTPPGSESIGNAFVRGQDQAAAARAQGMQNEVSQMQLQKMKSDAEGLAEFSRKVASMGGPSDPMEIARAYLAHPDVEMKKLGAGLMKKAQMVAAYDKMYPPTPATAAPVTTAPATMAPPLSPFNTNMVENTANALPAWAQPPAPTYSNALPATVGTAPAQMDENQLLRQIQDDIIKISPFTGPDGDPRANQRLATLNEKEKELLKSHNVAPGGTLVRAGLPNFNAPPAKSEFETLLDSSGLSAAEKTAARQTRVGKESTTSYEYLTTLDRLGKTTDPTERALLSNRLTQLSTHALPTQLKVSTFMPASEEAQRDFIKSTRATYDTLKQAPAIFANIEEARKLIPAASVFMGTGGEGMKTAASFLNNRLGMSINTEGVKNAEELRSRLFQGVLANLKKLDSQPSERQQAALEKALGSLDTDPNALANVMDAYADSLRNNIDTHNAEVQSAIARGVKFPYDPIIKVPAKANAPEVWVRDASGKLVKQ